ncbi:MAG TPA: thymidine kinase [Bacteroidetes bacterium]|nr:thymidine kinase [Bacteroidota bacterium]
MAKLYFRYSTMAAGKSLDLLKVAYNYKEKNQDVLLFTSYLDDRYGDGLIKSRVGLEEKASVINEKLDIYDHVKNLREWPDCILIDEAQFLTKEHILQITNVVDKLNVPVICYGLRSDYRAEPFEGSIYLMLYADIIEELKTICKCGKKASMNLRVVDDVPVFEGEQVAIGGNESYIAVCRKHYKLAIKEKAYSERKHGQ